MSVVVFFRRGNFFKKMYKTCSSFVTLRLNKNMYCYLMIIHYCQRWLELIVQCLTLHPGDYLGRGCCPHLYCLVVTLLARPKYPVPICHWRLAGIAFRANRTLPISCIWSPGMHVVAEAKAFLAPFRTAFDYLEA